SSGLRASAAASTTSARPSASPAARPGCARRARYATHGPSTSSTRSMASPTRVVPAQPSGSISARTADIARGVYFIGRRAFDYARPVPPAIELRDVQVVTPDGAVLLRGVDLSVEKGECVALVGPSGAGKSTTLRLV